MPFESALRDGDPAHFELIETMRWEPALGFVRVERHLERLAGSAAALGFLFERPRVLQALANLGNSETSMRVRLTLSREGVVDVTAQPFVPLHAGAIWTLRIAHQKLTSSDALLRHKTSRRDVYARARAEYSAQEADEVILLNERGALCEGTITNIFVDLGDDVLVTPPLECGLLPGILRGEMLDQGQAREALIRPEQLSSATAIYVGNSLRGCIPAKLATSHAD
ncbi:MAG: aminotransferase class IV family protein [Rhizobiaceae bacterium]|nr:aminotransferase class IV family protein [Rhizobiaceae bacterium]